MTREDARKAAKVMLAYADGKEIECCQKGCNDDWRIIDTAHFNWDGIRYRIKPQLKYRPFKDSDEAFEEMKKHEPFGWLKEKNSDFKMCSISLDNDGVLVGDYEDDKVFISYETVLQNYTFVDGSPIGIKEKEV